MMAGICVNLRRTQPFPTNFPHESGHPTSVDHLIEQS